MKEFVKELDGTWIGLTFPFTFIGSALIYNTDNDPLEMLGMVMILIAGSIMGIIIRNRLDR